jgi:mannose-6-phosphate isomerase-like protein (cupin superfamily)
MTETVQQARPVVVRAGEGISVWVPEEPPANLVDGEGPEMSTYTFMTTAETTGGALAVVDTLVPEGNGPPEHMHDDADESFYVLSGRFRMKAGDVESEIGVGDLVFVPRGTTHIWKNIGTGDGRLLRIYTPGGHEKFFFEIGRPAEPGAPAPRLTTADIRRAEAGVAKFYG